MNNCLFFALKKYLQEGGYLMVRRSKVISILPHFLHLSRDGKVLTHYAPKFPRRGWKAFVHKLWFDGEIRNIDPCFLTIVLTILPIFKAIIKTIQ